MVHRFASAIVIAGVTGLSSPSSAVDQHGITVTSRISWSSAAKPEVHLLLANSGDADRKISVFLPSEVECHGRSIPISTDRRSVFTALTRLHDSLTIGTVRAGGWLHRSFPIGGFFALDPPCTASYKISDWNTGELLAEGKIDIPRASDTNEWIDGSPEEPSIDLAVEVDEDYSGLFLARVLVTNKDPRGFVVSETDRRIQCDEGTRAEWAFRNSVLQGEDSGPMWIPPQSWAVFVNAIRVYEGRISDCRVEVEISGYLRDRGMTPLKSTSFAMDIQGLFKRPKHVGSR